MRVLVAVASKHGATAEIGRVIGDTLDAGHDVDVRRAEDVEGVDGFDAVVVGSAVYAGHWLDPAKRFITAHAEALRPLPVWLFSSGPIGSPLKPEEDPVDVSDLMEATAAVEHRIFSGKLNRSQLGFDERAIVRALGAPEGDFRDWDDIRAWASSVVAALEAHSPDQRPGW